VSPDLREVCPLRRGFVGHKGGYDLQTIAQKKQGGNRDFQRYKEHNELLPVRREFGAALAGIAALFMRNLNVLFGELAMPFEFPPAELMIIGDSLAQGCRSLTVKREFCAQSCAARIAQSQGWRFITPDFPIPVLFDLEQEIRQLDTGTIRFDQLQFKGLFGRVRDNLAAWLANIPTSAFTCFDNLGLSGCLIDDLYTRTARSSAEEVARLAPHGATVDVVQNLLGGTLGSLHLAINARFTLNPSRDTELDDLTPLDWVTRRRPGILLVQVGHNHGLYRIGSDAVATAPPGDTFTEPGGPGHAPYFDQWARLAAVTDAEDVGELAALPEVGEEGAGGAGRA